MALLDRERLTNYPRIFLALYVSLGGWWMASGTGLLDRGGRPIGADFVTFYSASRLALDGRAAEVWGVEPITTVERAVIGAQIPSYVFHYPPTFVVAITPLACLPYLLALAVWWAVGTFAFLWAVRRMAPFPAAVGLALAFPGFFQNIVQGQNGALTAALLGGGLALLGRSPILAGVLLGALTYKPHFAPLVAVALVFGRHGRAAAAALLTATAMVVVSVLVFGLAPWSAFLDNVPFALRVFEAHGVPWYRMPTVAASALSLRVPLAVAQALQTASTLGSIALVAWVWGRGANEVSRAVVLASASLLATPFAFDYDLAVLAVPIAFLAAAHVGRVPPPGGRGGVASQGEPSLGGDDVGVAMDLARDVPRATGGGTRPPPPSEIPLLAAAWAAPLWVPAVASATGVGLAPVLLVALVVVALRRNRTATV